MDGFERGVGTATATLVDASEFALSASAAGRLGRLNVGLGHVAGRGIAAVSSYSC
jgi:hypothetical protein